MAPVTGTWRAASYASTDFLPSAQLPHGLGLDDHNRAELARARTTVYSPGAELFHEVQRQAGPLIERAMPRTVRPRRQGSVRSQGELRQVIGGHAATRRSIEHAPSMPMISSVCAPATAPGMCAVVSAAMHGLVTRRAGQDVYLPPRIFADEAGGRTRRSSWSGPLAESALPCSSDGGALV